MRLAPLRCDERGRLTIPDILLSLMSLGFLAALYPVLNDGVQQSAPIMTTGTVYLYRLILPLGILVMLVMIYVKATGGRE